MALVSPSPVAILLFVRARFIISAYMHDPVGSLGHLDWPRHE